MRCQELIPAGLQARVRFRKFRLEKEDTMAQSQPSAAREQVRDIVPGLIDLSERVLFGEVWERPGSRNATAV